MSKKHKISGKRSGPPPLRGPNPNVPPIKMSVGGGADMGKDKGPETGRPGRDDRDIANRMAQTQQAAINKNKSFNGSDTPKTEKPNLVGNIVSGVITKAFDLPIGALNVAKNVFGPLTSGVRDKVSSITGVKGQNLNDYSPARTRNNIGPKFSGLDGNGASTQGLCPDGSMPPCKVVQASEGKSIKVRGTKAAIRGTGFKGVF